MPTQPAVIIITPGKKTKVKGGKNNKISPKVLVINKAKPKEINVVPTEPSKKPVKSEKPQMPKEKSLDKLRGCKEKLNQLERALVDMEGTLLQLEGLINPGVDNGQSSGVKGNGFQENNLMGDLLATPLISSLVMQMLSNLAK